MADFFKSALGILGGGPVREGNDFVGQYVELGNQKLIVRRLIAEGGYLSISQCQCGHSSGALPTNVGVHLC